MRCKNQKNQFEKEFLFLFFIITILFYIFCWTVGSYFENSFEHHDLFVRVGLEQKSFTCSTTRDLETFIILSLSPPPPTHTLFLTLFNRTKVKQNKRVKLKKKLSVKILKVAKIYIFINYLNYFNMTKLT